MSGLRKGLHSLFGLKLCMSLLYFATVRIDTSNFNSPAFPQISSIRPFIYWRAASVLARSPYFLHAEAYCNIWKLLYDREFEWVGRGPWSAPNFLSLVKLLKSIHSCGLWVDNWNQVHQLVKKPKQNNREVESKTILISFSCLLVCRTTT